MRMMKREIVNLRERKRVRKKSRSLREGTEETSNLRALGLETMTDSSRSQPGSMVIEEIISRLKRKRKLSLFHRRLQKMNRPPTNQKNLH